jgi:hypothetical protein
MFEQRPQMDVKSSVKPAPKAPSNVKQLQLDLTSFTEMHSMLVSARDRGGCLTTLGDLSTQ